MVFTNGWFDTDIDTWLGKDVECTLAVSVPGISSVDVLGLTVSMDETWAPFIQAELTVRGSSAVFAALDPRSNDPISITPGYRNLAGDTATAASPWKLYPRRVQWDHVTNQIRVACESLESLLQDWKWIDDATSDSQAGTAYCEDAIEAFVQHVDAGFTVTAYSGSPSGFLVGETVTMNVDKPDLWANCTDLADRMSSKLIADATSADDTLVTFPAGESYVGTATSLATGDGGFIEEWTQVVDRDGDWANAAMVIYVGPDYENAYTHEITTGTSGTTAAGLKVVVQRRNVPNPSSADTGAATSLATRAIKFADRSQLKGVAAFWLTPYYKVALPDGTAAVVSAITFDLVAGSMNVTTRSE